MKRVVVTGATSMIGVALIQECLKNNIEVLAILRRQSGRLTRLPKSSLLEICECELDEMEKLFSLEKSYDVFYHFAWANTSKATRDNPVLQEKNIKYVLDAVELAHRLGCTKFVGAGSQAEYGKIDTVITPDSPVNPIISYGMAKYAAGRLCEKRCVQLRMDYVWGRIFSVYGRYDNDGTMINYALEQFLKGKPAKFSAATQMWDYLYEEDAGKIFFHLGNKQVANGIYCIASGNSRPLKEFILEIQQCFGTNAVCEFAEETNDNAISLQADIGKLLKEIQYMPKVEFRDGISKVIKNRTGLLDISGDM